MILDPRYQGSENFQKLIKSKKNENGQMGVFDSSNKAPGRTDCNAKISALCDVPLLNKSGNTPQNGHILKMWLFLVVFVIFQQRYNAKS